MISTPEVSRRANCQLTKLGGWAFISISDNVDTPAVCTWEGSCTRWAETKYPESIRSTPTIASDKCYRNWNVLPQTWFDDSADAESYGHLTTASYAYTVVLKFINSCGIKLVRFPNPLPKVRRGPCLDLTHFNPGQK